MKITRQSPFTGDVNTKELDVTEEQLQRLQKGEELIQNIFPNLSPADREFLLTGYTEEDWNAIFGEEDYTNN